MAAWLPSDGDVSGYTESVRTHFEEIDKAQYGTEQAGDDEEGEVLCDTLFSLAYGALLLLSHTTLKLIRGRRYGILGPNGSGKTTLMRQLRDSKVENFPPQSQLRCVMVEHALQGEDTSLSVVDFIAAGMSGISSSTSGKRSIRIDSHLANIPREKIQQQLTEVGFDSARQTDLVASLSGGWKMRLELARAMLYNADLLLLDEVRPRFHSESLHTYNISPIQPTNHVSTY